MYNNKIVLSLKKKKKAELDKLFSLKNNLTENGVDNDSYIMKEYKKIIEKYDKEIEANKFLQDNNKKKKRLFENILKCKELMEGRGYKKEDIQNYIDRSYNEINNIVNIDFID